MSKRIRTLREAQKFVKDFARKNGWKDIPNVDKFDHLHEELIEMSSLLRYKTEKERVKALQEHREEFEDGIGDLVFGACRLANQLGVDIEHSINLVAESILKRYRGKKSESR